MAQQSEADLDNILASALDDFEDEEDQNVDAKPVSEMDEAIREGKTMLEASIDEANLKGLSLEENMAAFLENSRNPEFQKELERAFQQLGSENGGGENLHQLLGSLSAKGMGDEEQVEEGTDLDIGVARTLQGLAKAAEDMEGVEAAKAEEMGEDLMEEMMKEFEKMGNKKDFEGIVDNMMQQLLSKEVMYTPMKQICEKYPEWLAEKEKLLPPEEYERYGKQYQHFQLIVACYETEPDNYERLTELMQDMQETGQPPAEIVQELAPGLEFDDQGMPIMPNMGPGMMPAGGPLPGQDQCSLM